MPLRFCMVTTFYPPYHFGGDAVFVHELSKALVREGHHVEVVHCVDAYNLRGRPISAEMSEHSVNGDGIIVHRLQSRLGMLSPIITQQTGRPGLKRRAIEQVLDRSFDVIHFHNISLIGGPGVLAMGSAPVKLYTLHEHWMVCPMHVLWKNQKRACDKPQCIRCCIRSGTPPQLWRYTGAVGRGLRHIDALLSPSAFTADRHRQGGIVDVPIHHLPTFATIQAPLRSEPSEPTASRPRFLYVGRLTRSKGVTDLADVFEKLPQYDLAIAGDGELLEQMQARYGMVNNISLPGAVSREAIISLLQQATALILPCVGPEVFPLVVLEAIACGVPVIVRQAGGSAEAVEATGGGIAYKHPDELAGIVQRLADDPTLRNTLARRALAGYHERYTLETHLKSYFQIIDTIRAAKPPAPATLVAQ